MGALKDTTAAARRRRHSVDALDFKNANITDIGSFLRHIRLHKYTELFAEAQVTLGLLLCMDSQALVDAGVTALGARTRLLKATERYRLFLTSTHGIDDSPPMSYHSDECEEDDLKVLYSILDIDDASCDSGRVESGSGARLEPVRWDIWLGGGVGSTWESACWGRSVRAV